MKKILSVLLSLLLIFSTISVVFTLPTSAKTVTTTVFEENFDSLEQGSSLGSTQTIPTENGWVKTGAAYHDTVKNPTTDIDGFSFEAVSGTQVGAFRTWAKPGIVLNVTPGVTYNLTSKLYVNDIGSNFIKAIYVFDVTGKEGSTLTENWSRKTTVIDGTTVDAFANLDISGTRGAWLDGNISFTPAEGVTKVFIAFYSEGNGSTYTDMQKSLFIDDVKVEYTVEFGLPVVTTTTTGADDNGGVAWVEEIGENFVFEARPYENATFAGWYRDDNLVSNETTLTEAIDASANIEARFVANFANAWEKGSFEEYTSATADPSSSSDSGVLIWGKWDATDYQTINSEDWFATCYGRGYIANNTLLNSLLSGAKAYSGTKALVHKTGSHYIGKIVDVEPNKEYTLTFYTYSQDAGALSDYAIIGLDKTNGTVGMGVNDMSISTDGTKNNQTKLVATPVTYDNQTAGTWVKQQLTFNTSNYENVLIAFSKNGSGGYSGQLFIDHISLYADLRLQPEVTTTTVGNGSNGGYAWVSTGKVNAGDDITYNAKAYANAKFIGWYKNGELYETEESFTESYNPETYMQLEARFDAFATNLDTNASSEDYNVGELMANSSHTSPWSEVATNAYVKILSDHPEIAKMYYAKLNVTNTKAYSGSKALENIAGSNAHGFFKVYDVEPNSTYHFSYYYYQDSIKLESAGGYDTYPDAAVIPADADKIYIKGSSNVSNILITKEGQRVIDLFRDTNNVYFKGNNVVGEWSEVRYTFLTGENDTRVVIPLPSSLGVYFDHFTLYKEPDFESAYTLAVVPDTQKFNDDDIIPQDNDYDINAAFSKLYDDILAKKDSKNIQMVLSLGDVTENSFTSEYNRAKEQFARLDAANLPYTLVQGNHDYANQFKSNTDYATYKSTAEGSYNGILNTYHKFTVNGIKYLVLTLQFGYPDDVIAWANKITAANPDYNVIVTTHGYLEEEGLRLDETNGLSPGSMGTGDPDENGIYTHHATQNHATELWDEFISQHKNIVMVLSGHIDYDAVRITESYGDNGNKVLEMLIDGQNYDEYPRNENLAIDNSLEDVAYGMVAYFNFSADGKKLNIEYYSTNLEKLIYEVTVDVDVVETEVETLKVEATNGGVVSINGERNLNKEYKAAAGTSVTLSAEAFAGQDFIGWYEGETLLSTETTFTTTVATKTITAKFEDKNIIADSSFENAPIGLVNNWTFGASSGSWAKALVIDSVSYPRTPDASQAYSGNKMLEIHHRNNAGMYYELDVDKFAEYTLSLKWLLTLAYGDLTYNEELVVSTLKYVAVGTAEQTYYQEGKMLAEFLPGNSDGLWNDVTLDFTTGKNEKVRIFIEYAVGNADKYDAALGTSILYIDDFAIVKTAQGEEPACEHAYDNECDDTCNECGETRVAPHKYGNWTETTPGTCTTPGTETRYCENDASHFETREGSINADNHAWSEWSETRTPNCSDAGEKQRVCSHDATHVETEEIGIVEDAHNYGAWTVTRTPTCSDAGEKQRVCLHDANHVETAEVGIDENAHTYDDKYDADCNDCGAIREVPERPTFTLGDIDGNDSINNGDLIMLRRYLAGWGVEMNEEAADLDGSGEVNNRDAIWLARYLAGWDGYELN